MSAVSGAAASGQCGADPDDLGRSQAALDEALGAIRSPDRDIALNPGRPRRRLLVASRSARPVRVSSHYPFWRVNSRLEFDRSAAAGYRLDIPAGTSLRWAPGEAKTVDLVSLAHGEAPPEAPGQGEPAPAGEQG